METPETEDDRNSTTDILSAMEENRQKLQIKSAQMSLTAYKDFRVEKERTNKLDILEKEKNSTVVDTELEFVILNRMIKRRDEVIKNLRKNVVEEVILGKQGEHEEKRAKAIKSNQEEQVR
jgi:hypothetical protein